jgi:hypothetical protein
MAAVMVREAFEDGSPEGGALLRRPSGATRPVPVASATTVRRPRAAHGVGVVVDLQERRSRSVFDDEPEAVLRLVAPRARVPSSLPPTVQALGRHRAGEVRAHAQVRRARPSRRAWLVLGAVVLAIVGVAVTDDPAGGRLGGHSDAVSAAVPSAVEAPAPTVSIVVQPGDTLWSIAASLVGDGDPRPLVDELLAAHGGADLSPGDVITIPVP